MEEGPWFFKFNDRRSVNENHYSHISLSLAIIMMDHNRSLFLSVNFEKRKKKLAAWFVVLTLP